MELPGSEEMLEVETLLMYIKKPKNQNYFGSSQNHNITGDREYNKYKIQLECKVKDQRY